MSDANVLKEPSPSSEKENKRRKQEALNNATTPVQAESPNTPNKKRNKRTSKQHLPAASDDEAAPDVVQPGSAAAAADVKRKRGKKRPQPAAEEDKNDRPSPSKPKRVKQSESEREETEAAKDEKKTRRKSDKAEAKASVNADAGAAAAAKANNPHSVAESTPTADTEDEEKELSEEEKAAKAAQDAKIARRREKAKNKNGRKEKAEAKAAAAAAAEAARNAPPPEAGSDDEDSEAVPPPPVYNMMLPRKNTVDKAIDVEVESKRGETVAEAYAQAEREIKEDKNKGGNWPEDYIITAVNYKTRLAKVVMKYTGYARCSLVPVRHGYVPVTKLKVNPLRYPSTGVDLSDYMSPKYIEFWERNEALSKVFECLSVELKGAKNVRQMYPHRFAPKVEGEGPYEMVTDEITLNKSRLRAYEWRKTYEADQVNQPPIYFEDWTRSVGELPEFEYISMLEPSAIVQRALEKASDYMHIYCKSTSGCCKEEKSSCDSALTTREDKQSKHCGCYLIRRNSKSVDKSPFECTNKCACDPATCGNRVLQRGRQVPILVFKDFHKGWTTRAMTNINKGDYVAEYVGEVLTAYEAAMRDNHSYFMDMSNPKEKDDPEKGEKKIHDKLIIDGFKRGNETRFISHSCDPNLSLVPVYVERAGGWYSRMAFVARKKIATGQELTFDYFPLLKVEMAETNYNEIFENCMCGSPKCKFAPTTNKDILAKRAMAVNGGVQKERQRLAIEEGDSFADENRGEQAKMATSACRQQRYNARNKELTEQEKEMIEKATEESIQDLSEARDKSEEL